MVKVWRGILRRCYGKHTRKTNLTYFGCTVCNEWLHFSNFKKWFDENYIEGYEIDKDILVKGNKVYSPDKCRFVPRFINTLLLNRRNDRGDSPIGSTFLDGRYHVSINKYGKHYRLGSFDTPNEAFALYKSEKEKYIREVAESYFAQGKIDKDIYESLLHYNVNYND